MTILEAAEHYASIGISVVPTTDKVPPIKWDKYKSEIMSVKEIEKHFAYSQQVAAICGKVSRSMEVIDIDCKHDLSGTLYGDYCRLLNEADPTILKTVLIQKSISGGFHFVYLCAIIAGNKKIAKREDGEALIETRGEGGYFICWPSNGYQVLQGSYDNLPTISIRQREIIWDCAKTFNRHNPKIYEPKIILPDAPIQPGLSPGDDYDTRGDVIDLLIRHGWTITGQAEGKNGLVTKLKRPGESDSAYSAHFNFIPNRFYCWSTSTVFEEQTVYKPYAVFAILECDGDFIKAANKLYELGYGERTEPERAIKPKLSAKGFKKEEVITEEAPKDTRPTDKLFAPAQDFIDDYYCIRQNEISLFFEDNGVSLNEKQLNGIYVNMKRNGLKISYNDMLKLLNSPETPTYHPIKEFFDIQDKQLGDVKGNINQLISCILPHKPEYNPLFIRKWLVGMVATVYAERSNVLMLVLSGKINTGKSSFFENLLPTQLLDYYAPSKLDQGKDSDALMCSKLLILNDELDGMSNYEAKTFRNFVSATRYTYRPPYGTQNITRKRLATVCGTSNDKGIIADFENNRRIIPIGVESIDFKLYNSIDKTALLIEAYREYKSGYRWELSHDDITLLAEQTSDYRTETSESQILAKFFKIPETEAQEIPMTNAEILSILTEKTKLKLRQRELGMALREIGFRVVMKKIKGSRACRQVYLVQQMTAMDDTYERERGEVAMPKPEEDMPF